MRAQLISFAVSLCCATAAVAGCNAEMLTLTAWKITPLDATTNRLDTSFTYNGSKAIRMLDASAGFADVLGSNIASFALDRDMLLQPGQSFTQTGRWGQFTFERLLALKPEDVVTQTCLRGVVYGDGSVEKF